MGGSSLRGASLAARLRTELGVAVTLVDLFDAGTIRNLLASLGIAAVLEPIDVVHQRAGVI